MASSDRTASCPKDATVVGGGYEIDLATRQSGKLPHVVAHRPTETGWRGECVDAEGKVSQASKAYVICATALR